LKYFGPSFVLFMTFLPAPPWHYKSNKYVHLVSATLALMDHMQCTELPFASLIAGMLTFKPGMLLGLNTVKRLLRDHPRAGQKVVS